MKKLVTLIAILSLFAVACGGEAGKRTASVGSGSVALPEGFKAGGLEIVSLNQIAKVDADGRFNVKLPDEMISFVMVRDAATRKPVYYGYFFPKGMGTGLLDSYTTTNIKIDDASTALTLAMVNPIYFASTLEQKAENAEKVLSHSKFPELVAKIKAARARDFYSAVDDSVNHDIFVAAKELAVMSLAENASDRLPAEMAEQKIVVDSAMAWPETAGNQNIRFKNPKFVYYAAAPFANGEMKIQYPILIKPKEEIIDFSIWPPSFEIVDTIATTAGVPAGSYQLKIFKGIQLNTPIDEVWANDVSRVALLANTWLTIQMIVSLCGDIGILPGGSVGVDLLFKIIGNTPAEWIYTLYQEINDKDVMGIINAFVDFFKANAGSIAGEVSGSFSSGSSDPAAASSLISQAASLTGIASSLFNVVNSEVPFFYDLINSHELGIYNIVNGVVQDNAPDTASSSSSSSCSASPTSGNGIWLILVLAPIAIFSVRRRLA